MLFFFPWETRRAPATDKLSLDRHKITAKYIILLEIFNQLSFFKYKVPLKICHKYWILHACNNTQLTHSTHKYYTHTTCTLHVCSCCNPFDQCSIMTISVSLSVYHYQCSVTTKEDGGWSCFFRLHTICDIMCLSMQPDFMQQFHR